MQSLVGLANEWILYCDGASREWQPFGWIPPGIGTVAVEPQSDSTYLVHDGQVIQRVGHGSWVDTGQAADLVFATSGGLLAYDRVSGRFRLLREL